MLRRARRCGRPPAVARPGSGAPAVRAVLDGMPAPRAPSDASGPAAARPAAAGPSRRSGGLGGPDDPGSSPALLLAARTVLGGSPARRCGVPGDSPSRHREPGDSPALLRGFGDAGGPRRSSRQCGRGRTAPVPCHPDEVDSRAMDGQQTDSGTSAGGSGTCRAAHAPGWAARPAGSVRPARARSSGRPAGPPVSGSAVPGQRPNGRRLASPSARQPVSPSAEGAVPGGRPGPGSGGCRP